MKKIKFWVFSITSVLLILFILSCNDDSVNNNDSNKIEKRDLKTKSEENANFNYSLEYEDRLLKVELERNEDLFQNTFTYIKDNEILFTLNYEYNSSIEGWKYSEQAKALEFANNLKDINLEIGELSVLNLMLDESVDELYFKVSEFNYDIELFGVISYLKSATAANLRMLNNNEDSITGTISPSFLVGKSPFIFQEDFIFDLDKLRSNLLEIEAEIVSNGSVNDKNVLSFIKESTLSKVSYDKLYSFYVSKDKFINHIEERAVYKAGDCKESCIIGCGTDWGCCGSYMGCCYYSANWCLWHDLECTNCDKWHCGPSCKPDGVGGNRKVKLILDPR